MSKVREHTIESMTKAIIKKNIKFLTVINIDKSDNKVILKDNDYGLYAVDIKHISPKTKLPLHSKRRFYEKFKKTKKALIGKTIKGVFVSDIFYGPDEGYKNRSFYIIGKKVCGHELITTKSILEKHRNEYSCGVCDRTVHGERSRINGELPKRTRTYIHWQRIKNTLPGEFQSYINFRKAAGDKPPQGRYDLIIDNDKIYWNRLDIVDDYEINLIATAVRQAFRYSFLYKEALEKSKVETETSTKYRCVLCKELFNLKQIQVDHIEPIQPINGSKLTRDQIIPRTWTKNIQVLDRKCHAKKSSSENKLRRQNKKESNKK